MNYRMPGRHVLEVRITCTTSTPMRLERMARLCRAKSLRPVELCCKACGEKLQRKSFDGSSVPGPDVRCGCLGTTAVITKVEMVV